MILTNDEISDIYEQPSKTPREFARSIEQAVIEKLQEQEPMAFYDGNKFYANEESAICGCADMTKLKPVFTHPAPSAPEVEAKYNELIMAVGRKFKGESRHATALKYIRQMEERSSTDGCKERGNDY